MKVRIKYLFACLLIALMFSVGAVAASENVTSQDLGSELNSLSVNKLADIEEDSKISNSGSINEVSILNSSNDDNLGSSNNDMLKTDVSGGNFSDIANAITNTSAGGTVFLNGQNYRGNTQITINKNITIDGASGNNSNLFSVLNAGNSSRIFYSSGAYNIILKNLILEDPGRTITQGYFAYFNNLRNITLENVIIRNQNLTGILQNAFYIAGSGTTLNVNNLTFSNNTLNSTANLNGGLFYINSRTNASIRNLDFYDNKIMVPNRSINGGVLSVGQYCNVNIENINYYGNLLNSSSIYGSFILTSSINSSSNISVKNWNFDNNELVSGNIRGGIYLNRFCRLSLDNLNFTKNRFESASSFSGMAVYSASYNSSSYITNVRCDYNVYVLNGTAKTNGAFIYASQSNLTILNISFSHNNVSGYDTLSGMIYLGSSGMNATLILDNLQFYNNYFSGSKTHGAAVFTAGNQTNVTMNNMIIEHNYVGGPVDGSETSGGFLQASGFGVVSNCHAFNNTANRAWGGIIRLTSQSLDNRIILENSTFINTSVRTAELECDIFYWNDHGGVVCVASTDAGAIIRNCLFVNNFHSTGGALAPHNQCIVENCTFINNTATKYYGGAIATFHGKLDEMQLHKDGEGILVIKDCYFEGNSAPLGGAIQANGDDIHIYGCTFVNNTAVKGGAIFLFGSTLDVHNSTFIDNTATDDIPNVSIGELHWQRFDWTAEGGAIYCYGYAAHLFNNTLRYNIALGKDREDRGGAIYVHGNHTVIELTHFDDNFAYGGNGSAVYIWGFNNTIKTSEFFNHSCSRGTVYILGDQSFILDTIFEHNVATSGGGAVYIFGDYSLIDGSYFRDNNATIHGGAIHTHGDHVTITRSQFFDNNAVPHPVDTDQGLGGAIFIRGDHNEISYSFFDGNTARNGSAIYNRGVDLHIDNDTFLENQAFSYLLATIATPQVSYYNGSNRVLINITHIGGDNIINAIYHDDSPLTIFFHNVTYEHSTGIRTTTDSEIHPVDGAEKSQGGSILYQDPREDLQLISIVIVRNEDNSSSVLTGPAQATGEVIVDTVLRTGLYGNASLWVTDKLTVGTYSVYSKHSEDRQYKEIENQTQFKINPTADLEIIKTVSNANPKSQDIITWTLTVVNHGPSDSENVSVSDVLPKNLIYVSDDSNGKYDPVSGTWIIGDMAKGASVVLKIKAIVNASNTQITNYANVTSDTYDMNLSNNNDSEKITVRSTGDVGVVKDVSKIYLTIDEVIVWTIIVTNHGPEVAKNVVVSDVLPAGLKLISFKASVGTYRNGVWKVGALENGSSETLKLTTKITIPTGRIVNIASVTTDSYDSNKSNNRDFAVVYVNSPTDLVLTKQANVKQVKVGDIIIWKITVKNNGPNRAVNTKVYDMILKGKTEYVGSKVSKGAFYSGPGIWVIGDLDVGESVTLILKTKALASGEVINFAKVVCDNPETDNSNNNDSDFVVVGKDPSSGESNSHASKTLHAAGNPIVLVILALLAIVFVGFKRKY